jgi:hypothetical protein
VDPPAEVAEVVAAAVPRVHTAESADDAVDTGLLRPLPVEPDVDVVYAGAAGPDARAAVATVRAAGLSVRLYGTGWDDPALDPELVGVAYGPLPYPSLAAALCAGRSVLVAGPGAAGQALAARACSRPVRTAAAPLTVAPPAAEPPPCWRDRWRDLLGPAPARTRDRGPRVSVVIPAYGVARYVGASVESVLASTYPDFEVVLLDDGSTDGTAAVLRRFAGAPQVRVVRQGNVGQRGRFDLLHRRTAALARGDLLAYLGGDDLAHPDRLAEQVAAFDADPDLDICHSAGALIDGADRPGGPAFALPEPYSTRTLLRNQMGRNVVAHPTVMLHRRAFDRVGPYEEGFASDYGFWLKAAGRLRFRYLARSLVSYRVHEDSASTSAAGLRRAMAEGARLLTAELARRTITDLYPELVHCRGDRAALAAARVDLGNRLLGPYPELALAEYDRAAALLGPGHRTAPLVGHNRAVALTIAGQREAAARVVEGLEAVSPPSARLAAALRLDRDAELSALPLDCCRGESLSPEFVAAGVRADRADPLARSWDGSPPGARRALVVLDPGRPDLGRRALAGWCAGTSAGTPVQLVIPTLGRSAEAVVADLAGLLAGLPHDVAAAGDLVVEPVDSLALLPPGHVELALVLSTPAAVDELAAWVRSAGSSASDPAA